MITSKTNLIGTNRVVAIHGISKTFKLCFKICLKIEFKQKHYCSLTNYYPYNNAACTILVIWTLWSIEKLTSWPFNVRQITMEFIGHSNHPVTNEAVICWFFPFFLLSCAVTFSSCYQFAMSGQDWSLSNPTQYTLYSVLQRLQNFWSTLHVLQGNEGHW